jgi:hypothetical protein
MAKDINDNEPDHGPVTEPASRGDLKGMMADYGEKNEAKKAIANSQKTLLKEFSAAHGVPEWISKILIKFEGIEDEAIRAHAWRALTDAGHELGFDQQADMFAKSAPDPERPRRARAMA